jgi:hypothetical protein
MSPKVASDKQSRHGVQFLARWLPFLRGRPRRYHKRCFATVACPDSCAPCSSNTSVRSAAVADRKWINVEAHSASNNSLPQQARLLLVVVSVSHQLVVATVITANKISSKQCITHSYCLILVHQSPRNHRLRPGTDLRVRGDGKRGFVSIEFSPRGFRRLIAKW